MWSGPPQWTQWALNPSAYQDMANDQVDWARLAQQWIMMKESAPVNLPEPPPPAMEKPIGEEGGEAPMDIGKDEDGDEPNDAPPAGWNNSSNWNNWSQQWGGYNSWSPGSHGSSQTAHSAGNSLLPNPSVTKNGSDSTAYSYSTTTPGFDYNTTARGDSFQPPAGFWPDGMMPPGTAGGQMPFVRGHGRGQRWEGKANKIGRGPDIHPSDEEEEAEPVIDAAKRRTLPIWIREGLEKMEREKQKQLERERAEKAREEAIKLRRQKEQEVMNEIQADKGVPPRSKFDTDSEEGSENEGAPQDQREPSPPVLSDLPKRKSRFHDGPPRPPSPIRLTKEEQMLKVRRTMTEVLLEVTSEMLRSVARESFVWYQRKGLAMYGSGSDGDSDSESDQEGGTRNQTATKAANSSGDSDSELRDEIRRRQQDFKEQEREIEAMAAESEERERRGGRGVSAGREQTEVTDSGSGVIPERQVESESASHTTDAGKDAKSKTEVEVKSSNHKSNEKNDKSNHKSSKSDKKKKSDSSVSSDESTSSSRSSKRRHKRKHKERKKEKEKRRSKERDRKSRRDRSSSASRRDSRKSRRERSNSARRSRSRSRSRHRDDDSKKRRRDRSDSRRRSRKRSHSSDSDRRRNRRRSRSRSGSRNRHRRRRSSSRSSSDSSRHRRSSRR